MKKKLVIKASFFLLLAALFLFLECQMRDVEKEAKNIENTKANEPKAHIAVGR